MKRLILMKIIILLMSPGALAQFVPNDEVTCDITATNSNMVGSMTQKVSGVIDKHHILEFNKEIQFSLYSVATHNLDIMFTRFGHFYQIRLTSLYGPKTSYVSQGQYSHGDQSLYVNTDPDSTVHIQCRVQPETGGPA